MNKDRLIGMLLIIATTASWGGAWVTARAAAHDAPALWTAVGRFVFAAVALGVIAVAMKRPISLRHDLSTWRTLFWMGMTGAIGYNVFFLIGIQQAPASDGAVITPGLAGLSGALMVWLFDGHKPRRWAIIGGIFSLVGAITIGSGALQTDAARLAGQAMFAGAAVIWGFYTMFGRRLQGKVSAVESVFWATLIGTILLTPFAWWQGGPPAAWSAGAWGNMVYLGLIATAVGFVTWYLAVQRLGADGAGPGLGLVPAFGVTGAVVFLGESLAWQHIAGAVLVVVGIALSGRPDTLRIHVEREFSVSAQALWARVGKFDDIATWGNDLASSHIVAGEGLAPGTARFCEFTKPAGKIRGVTETVESVHEMGYTYRVTGLDAYDPVSTWQVAEADGGSRLVFVAEMKANWLGHLFWPLTKKQLTAGMNRALDGLEGQLLPPATA